MATILVLGASRGIGLEFARQYCVAGDRVIATARDDAALQRLQALGAHPLRVDVAEPASISSLGWQLDGEQIELALYVAGVTARGGATQPPAQADFDRVMRTNVLGAMQAIPRVAPLVESASGVFAFISSRMGQISTVESSNAWLYRASKAALNMAVAAAQHDYPKATFVSLHPGWVRTDLGGAGAPLTTEESVTALRKTLAGVTPRDRGAFINYDGQRFTGW